MNSKVVKDGGGSMKSLSSGKKDSNTPHIDSGVDSGLSYRSQNSNSNSDSQCSDSASCNSTQCAQVMRTKHTVINFEPYFMTHKFWSCDTRFYDHDHDTVSLIRFGCKPLVD